MKKYKLFILILLITLLGGFLRFYDITKNPPSLNIDEVSFGYSAYSILKTARDEKGKFLPLTFESTGDYKNPIPIYLMVPSIAIFGLGEFGVRFPTALLGTLSIPIFFFIIKKILKDNRAAIIGALLFAISPWHIFFSRYAYDPLLANFFLLLGILFFLQMIEVPKKLYALLSGLFFGISMYSAFANRLFVPFFIAAVAIIYFKKLKTIKGIMFLFALAFFILVLPLAYLSLFSKANTRLGMIFLWIDIDFTRYTVFGGIQKLGDYPILFFFWLKRYLNYFQPDFLFFSGLNMTAPKTLGLGVMYLFELPWLILGTVELLKNKVPYKGLVILWILIGIFPASLTNNEQSEGRTLIIAPALIFIVTLGFLRFIKIIKNLPKAYLKVAVTFGYSVFIILILIHAFLVFAVHFPIQKGEDFMEGTKEAALYAIKNKNQYKEIVFDPNRGIEGPYIVSIPDYYLLFYSKYDPKMYQNEKKVNITISPTEAIIGFDKFTIRRIKWPEDKNKKDTLFIGSPWDFPQGSLKEGELLKTVYMINNYPAFYIVSPKQG